MDFFMSTINKIHETFFVVLLHQSVKKVTMFQ